MKGLVVSKIRQACKRQWFTLVVTIWFFCRRLHSTRRLSSQNFVLKTCTYNNPADQIHVHVCNVLCVFSGIPLILLSFVVFDVPAAADDKENLAVCLDINSRGLHRCLYFILFFFSSNRFLSALHEIKKK